MPLAPNAIERVYDKFMDHLIASDPLEYYVCLANAIGKQIGWYKADNDAGNVLNSSFPFAPPPPPASAVHPMSPMLVDLRRQRANVQATTSDPKYQQQLQSEMKELAPMLGKAYRYLLSDPDYLVMRIRMVTSTMLLVEGRGGKLHCGRLTLRVSSPVITHLVNACTARTGDSREHHDELMRAFIDGVAEMGGPRHELER